MSTRRQSSPQSQTPYLSAIICTLNRYPDVEVCLDALTIASKNATVPHEIVVIDQTDPPARRDDLEAAYPGIRHIHQNDKGLSVARNLGAAEAKGEIIAYLDDDAVPSENWFTEMAAPFQQDEANAILACGGKVLADYRKGAKPIWMTRDLEHYLSCIDWGEKLRPLNAGEWIVGANMAFRRQVFETMELFDPALGRKGSKTLLSNEEVSMIEKIGQDRIWYSPTAVIQHVIGPERLEQRWFRRRVYWQAISDLIADIVWLPADDAWGRIEAFFTAAPAELRSIIGLFHDMEDADLLDRQLKAIYALGILGSAGFELPAAFTLE